MRIIAGTAKGRALEGPKDNATRPTSDRTRQSLFDVLGQWCEGLRVLDCYAGTGALALEAISRGAVSAVLIDSSADACALIKRNAASLGFAEQIDVRRGEVARVLPQVAGQSFDLVFVDPPYALRAGTAALQLIAQHGLLATGGRVVVEHDKREVLAEEVAGLRRIDERSFGDTRASIFAA